MGIVRHSIRIPVFRCGQGYGDSSRNLWPTAPQAAFPMRDKCMELMRYRACLWALAARYCLLAYRVLSVSAPHAWTYFLRVLHLVPVEVLSPQLAPLGASFSLPRPSACTHAGWAVDVVELVSLVCFLPGWCGGHGSKKEKARWCGLLVV